jgi:hypothetical protein
MRERTRGTNQDLRDYYWYFNKKYFSNKLPKDMSVRFEDIDGLGLTPFTKDTNRPLYIHISNRIRHSSRLTAQTLLHEMVHVAHPEKRGHKNWFDKEMLKLAKKGAFNGLW